MAPTSLTFITLDVFTSTPFAGNPLAIILVPSPVSLSQTQEQLIAREFNLSESVFIHEHQSPSPLHTKFLENGILNPNGNGNKNSEWVIDIFTTNDELPFAGHPTIGAAWYVLNQHSLQSGTFITKAGRIPIALLEEGVVQAHIPHSVHIHNHTIGDLQNPIPGLSTNKRLAEAEMRAPIVSIVQGMTFLLVQLETLQDLGEVQATSPDLSFHGLLDGGGWQVGFVARYYFVILKEERGNEDWRQEGGKGVTRIRTRMLEIAMEDPATGSAACALGSYLALKGKRTRKFEVTQGVEMGRESVIGVEVVVADSGREVESVRLSGSAVQVMEGSLRI
jgi:PhzF family phenazine biosynthesis protein